MDVKAVAELLAHIRKQAAEVLNTSSGAIRYGDVKEMVYGPTTAT